eukprot:1248080-Alexandrium_andersonii.AAC.1
MQHRCKHAKPELRGPRSGLEIGPRSSRGAGHAPFPAHNPNLSTNVRTGGVRIREIAKARTPIRNPPIRNPRNSWLLACEEPARRPRGPSSPDGPNEPLRGSALANLGARAYLLRGLQRLDLHRGGAPTSTEEAT